jgi:polyisoprenoid-binding protein YceI
MKNNSWIVMSALLWGAQAQAQPTPSTQPAQPAGAATKPANAAAPGAGGLTTSTAGVAVPAKTAPTTGATTSANNDKSVEWTLDAAHSHVGFSVRHLVSKTSGQFKKYGAVVKADPKTAKITSLEATVETASIDTGIEKRDTHLRGDDFFATDKYPQLKVVLGKPIKWNGNKFTTTADVTIRDVTKAVPFKGELLGVHAANFGQGEHTRAGYEATATINRKDFGLKFAGVNEGIALVGDEVTLEINAELMYTPTTASAQAPAKSSTGAVASANKPEAATTPAAPTAKQLPAANTKPATAAPAAPAKPATAPAHAH